jgi:hypothetical protein
MNNDGPVFGIEWVAGGLFVMLIIWGGIWLLTEIGRAMGSVYGGPYGFGKMFLAILVLFVVATFLSKGK